MKNDRLLNAIGQINEEYIAEADVKMNKRVKFYKRPMALVAVLTVCILASSVIALAKTGVLSGYFKDIKNPVGAAVGTEYEGAEEETNIEIIKGNNQLTALVTMLYPNEVPYSEFEELGVDNYKIVAENGEIMAKGSAEMTKIKDGKAVLNIPLDGIPSGSYKLIISKMVGGKKADAPLVMGIDWECEFTQP